MMRGVLKPLRPGQDAYSQVTPLENFDAPYQQHHHQQTPTHHHQSDSSWPGVVVETGYQPSNTLYGTPSTQQYNSHSQYSGAYATPTQPSSASQSTQYNSYDPSSNTYSYHDSVQATPYGQQSTSANENLFSPDSAQKKDTRSYGVRPRATANSLQEFATMLQADIDASFVNGVHEVCKTELSLAGGAFIPLMRPKIGPYAEGGVQDLPEEFKKNYPEPDTTEEDATAESQSSQAGQGDTQGQPQETSTQSGASTQPQQDGSAAPEQTPTEPNPGPTQKPPAPPPPLPKLEDPLKTCPTASVDSILDIEDADVRGIVQRAASRGLIQRIMNLDDFKYMFNNFWTSRHDGDGLRYSYNCRDSLQNKDRHAHVPARASTVPPVHREMLRRTKESWDCKGSISIKFSPAIRAIVVQYRHAAIHPTIEDRRRPPRKPSAPRSSRPPGRPRGSRGTKRKRTSDDVGHGYDAGLPLPLSGNTPARFPVQTRQEPSLFELLQQSAVEREANDDGEQLGSAARPWWGSAAK
jgi:hypothetical protein